MAREITTVIRSDLSGDIVPEKEAVRITIQFLDGRRNKIELDAAEHEVDDLASKGRGQASRAAAREQGFA